MAEAKIRVTVEDRASAALESIAGSVKRLDTIASAQALMGFAQTLGRWAEEGDRASDIFGALTYDLDGLQRATAGTVSALQLAEISNRAMAAGLNLTQRQLEAVVAAGTEYARVTGGDATSSTERLLGALVSGRERGLLPFGVHANTTAEAIEQLTGRLGRNESSLRQNSGAMDRAGATVDNLKTSFKQLAADGVEMFLRVIPLVGSRTQSELASAGAAIEAFGARFRALAVEIGNAFGFTEGMSEQQVENWAGTAEGVAAFRRHGFRTQFERDHFMRLAQRQGRRVQDMLAEAPLTAMGQREVADDARRASERQAQEEWQAGERQAADDRDRRERARMEVERERYENRGGGGGGGGGRESAEERERQAREDRELRDRTAMEQWLEDFEDAQARGMSPGEISWEDLVAGQRGAVRGARVERNTSVGRARRSDGPSDRNGLRAATREVVSLERAYEQLGSTATDVLDALGTAVAGHFEAWAMGRETMGEALAGMTADLFKWMGQQALKKAGMEAIEAIAAAARYDFGAAALHTAAAVGFGALAGGSFYVAGQVGGSSGRSTHGRDERSSTRDLGADRSLGGQGFGGPSVVINIAPGGIIGPDAAEVVGRLAVDGVNRGIRLGGMPRFDSSAIRTSGSRA